jgi:hypothetical protein
MTPSTKTLKDMKGLVYLNNRGKVAMEELQVIMAMPAEAQRFMWYTQKINKEFAITQTWTSDDDTHFYVKRTIVHVRFNKKLYCKYTPDRGFAYNKVTKDIKPWFGGTMKTMDEEMLNAFFAETSLDWLVDAISTNKTYRNMLGLSILKRILKGKITNRLDLVKAYIKSSPSFAGSRTMPVSRIVKYLNEKSYHGIDDMISYIKVSVNPEATANAYISLDNNASFMDHWKDPNQEWINFGHELMNQAKVLDRKIDFTWSYRRMLQVHEDWTRDIMGMELEMVPDTNFEYEGDLWLPEGLKLISNQKDLFKEGSEMHHCVYTNHRYNVIDKREFIFCGDFGNDRFTVSVVSDYGPKDHPRTFSIQQMYGKRNSQVKREDKHKVELWVDSTPVQQWLRANYNDGSNRRRVELGDALPF